MKDILFLNRSWPVRIWMWSAVLCLVFPANAQKNKSKKNAQYKKHPRDQITAISSGEVAEAQKFFESYLAKQPDDLESHYGLVICHAQKSDLKQAMAMARAGVTFVQLYFLPVKTVLSPKFFEGEYSLLTWLEKSDKKTILSDKFIQSLEKSLDQLTDKGVLLEC